MATAVAAANARAAERERRQAEREQQQRIDDEYEDAKESLRSEKPTSVSAARHLFLHPVKCLHPLQLDVAVARAPEWTVRVARRLRAGCRPPHGRAASENVFTKEIKKSPDECIEKKSTFREITLKM